MQTKLIRYFIFSAAILLSVTAIAKLISGFGSDKVLERHDPLFTLSYRNVFWIVGTLELGISLICFFGKRVTIQTGLLAWLATSFLVYHFSMPWVGYQRPCPCLGNLTDAIHISPQTADTAMKIILAYLLIGSYGTLFWLWRQSKRQNEEVRMKNEEVTPETGVGS